MLAALMRRHAANAAVQSGCFALIEFLAQDSPVGSFRLGIAGACEAVVAALRAHVPDVPDNQRQHQQLKYQGIEVEVIHL